MGSAARAALRSYQAKAFNIPKDRGVFDANKEPGEQ
jgi:hypothetical protein